MLVRITEKPSAKSFLNDPVFGSGHRITVDQVAKKTMWNLTGIWMHDISNDRRRELITYWEVRYAEMVCRIGMLDRNVLFPSFGKCCGRGLYRLS